MVMCCTAAREPGPRNWISPMWLTSKRPTAVRTAMCSAIRPAAGAGIFDGHVPPAEVDHFGLEGAVGGVECGLLERGRGGCGGCEV